MYGDSVRSGKHARARATPVRFSPHVYYLQAVTQSARMTPSFFTGCPVGYWGRSLWVLFFYACVFFSAFCKKSEKNTKACSNRLALSAIITSFFFQRNTWIITIKCCFWIDITYHPSVLKALKLVPFYRVSSLLCHGMLFPHKSLCISEAMLADVKNVWPKSIFSTRLSTLHSNHIPHKIYIIQQHIKSSW
jgi:hypothetical protein